MALKRWRIELVRSKNQSPTAASYSEAITQGVLSHAARNDPEEFSRLVAMVEAAKREAA